MHATFSQTQPSSSFRRNAVPGTTAAEREHLLGALFEELLNSSLLTAASASIAIWTLQHIRTGSPRNLACYLPPKPMLFPQTLLAFSISFDLSGSLRAYYDQLEFLRGLTLDYAENTAHHREDDLDTLEMLSSAWQDLSATARQVASGLAAQVTPRILERHRDRYEKLMDLLSAIESGQHPCVDANGAVTVPFWAERRQLRRRSLNLQAYLVVGQSISRVAVINASVQGIGVQGLTEAKVGTVAQLLISPGQSITGTVVWVNEDRAGIALEKPLPENSSLQALIH